MSFILLLLSYFSTHYIHTYLYILYTHTYTLCLYEHTILSCISSAISNRNGVGESERDRERAKAKLRLDLLHHSNRCCRVARVHQTHTYTYAYTSVSWQQQIRREKYGNRRERTSKYFLTEKRVCEKLCIRISVQIKYTRHHNNKKEMGKKRPKKKNENNMK